MIRELGLILLLVFGVCLPSLGQLVPPASGQNSTTLTAEIGRVGLACGFAGSPTPAVITVGEHCRNGAVTELQALLFSLNTAEAYLSALALIELFNTPGEPLADQLSAEAYERLEAILSGEGSFIECSGCTSHKTVNARSISRSMRSRLVHYFAS